METNEEMDALFDKALRHEQRGDWDKAIALYEQAAKKWPEQATFALNCVAELRARQGTYGRSEDTALPPDRESRIVCSNRTGSEPGPGIFG